MPARHLSKDIAQRINVMNEPLVTMPLQGIDGKKMRATRMAGASLIGRHFMVPQA